MAKRQKPEMRNHILNKAASLFVVHGYEGISIREIAEACQLSKAGLYYHFKDKEDLFLEILNYHLSGLEELLAEIRSNSGNTRDTISKFIRAVFTQLPINHRSIFRLAQLDLEKIDPAKRAAFNQRYHDEFLTPLSDIIKIGVSSDQIKAIDCQFGVWALLGLMYPFFNTYFNNQPEEVEKIIVLIETIFFDGLEIKPGRVS
jgi:AcrR family transcriptional regulator